MSDNRIFCPACRKAAYISTDTCPVLSQTIFGQLIRPIICITGDIGEERQKERCILCSGKRVSMSLLIQLRQPISGGANNITFIAYLSQRLTNITVSMIVRFTLAAIFVKYPYLELMATP